MYNHVSQHTARREHKRPCEWCGEPIVKGDKWTKNATMGGEFNVMQLHEECHDRFQEEFQHYCGGTLLGIESFSNDRGKPAKEGTIYEG